jgi:ABC-type transport system substrate-binding protein
LTSRRLVRALLVVAVLVAACSSDDGTDGGRAGRPIDGGTVRLGLPGPIQADPALASVASPSDLMVLDLLHDGLTRTATDGEVVGELATRWAQDGTFRTWTFFLDPEATFSSGRAITAADVVASLEHVAAGGDASIAALQLEVVTGFRAFLDGTAPHIAGLRATDLLTVEVALDSPLASLPVLLASPSYGVIDRASTAAAPEPAVLADLDLSGSWQVSAARPEALTVSRRGGTPGRLDAVELRQYEDSAHAYAAFRDGEVDWAPVPGDEFGAAVAAYGGDAFAPFHAELLLGLRVTGAALSRPELRQAIAAAVDREAIVRAVYPDLAVPLLGVVPAGIPGHRTRPCGVCRYDPPRARALLAAAFPDGQVPAVAIDVERSPAQEALAAIVAESLAEVGIPTNVRSRPLEDHERFVVTGAQELFTFGWIGGYRSPDAYLAPLFGSGSPENLTGLQDAEVDALLRQAEATMAEAGPSGPWATVEERLLQAVVVIPIAQFRTQVVVAPRVTGLSHAVDATVDWAAVGVTAGP